MLTVNTTLLDTPIKGGALPSDLFTSLVSVLDQLIATVQHDILFDIKMVRGIDTGLCYLLSVVFFQ